MTKKKIVSILLIAVVLFSSSPTPVYAAGQTRAVDGALTTFQGLSCSYVGGAADFTVLNSNDDDTSYAKVGAASSPYYGRVCWPFEDFVEDYTSIANVTVSMRVRREGATGSGVVSAEAYIGSTWYLQGSTSISTSYGNYDYTYYTNPATGLSWTDTDINNASFGFVASSDNVRVTYLYISVYYYPPSAPTVTTDAADDILSDSVTLNGTVVDDDGGTIDYYGFVWDTSDKGDPGDSDPSVPPGTWTNGWKSAEGDYGENPFDHSTGATLVKGTTYYFRAAAHNSGGWSYGDAVSFVTVDDPVISTQSATFIGDASAQLNAKMDNDGGEACDVTFAYKDGSHADYAAIVLAGGTETAVAGTWETGEFPYLAIASLAASTTYTFACKAENDAGTGYGSAIEFTTLSGVYAPDNLVAFPQDDNSTLSWEKNAPTTLVRYQTGSYPTAIDEGELAYFGITTAINIDELTSGVTYYVSAWGFDDGTYSDNYTYVMFTTVAYDVTPGDDLEVPEDYSPWQQNPDSSMAGLWPLLGGLVAAVATSYNNDASWTWYLIVILVATGAGVVVYSIKNNLTQGAMAVALVLFGSAIAFKLIWLWAGFAFVLIYLGFTMFGERR